jgi:cytochrome c-type biogenesis protein CcmH
MKRLCLLAALVACLAAQTAAVPRTSLHEIETEVMCQVCGTPLALAQDSPEASRERSFIMGLIDQGETKQQIEQALVAQYGPGVLAVPKDQGFDLSAYLVPIGALAAALAAVGVAVVRWRNKRARDLATQAPGAPSIDSEQSQRLEADLMRYDP